jgi:hypothetical protein
MPFRTQHSRASKRHTKKLCAVQKWRPAGRESTHRHIVHAASNVTSGECCRHFPAVSAQHTQREHLECQQAAQHRGQRPPCKGPQQPPRLTQHSPAAGVQHRGEQRGWSEAAHTPHAWLLQIPLEQQRKQHKLNIRLGP